jgi:ABC-type dipeptide/oligopeptide/nickel transport system ATPase subunit
VRCQRYFSDLVPGKRLDLVPVDSGGNLEEGLKFVLVSDRDTCRGSDTGDDGDMSVESLGSVSDSEEEDEGKSKDRRDRNRKDVMLNAGKKRFKSTEELSGGQRALLGLSFVFAAALHKTSPLYLLDEVQSSTYLQHLIPYLRRKLYL